MKMNPLELYAKPFVMTMLGLVFFSAYAFLLWLTFQYTQFYKANFTDFIFNVHLHYTPEQLYQSLSQLNPALIRSYPLIALVDVFIALLYGVFGGLVSHYIISSVTQKPFFLAFPYLFLIASVANWCEDFLLSVIFLKFPQKEPLLVQCANLFTLSKYLLLGTGILLPFLCLIILKRQKTSGLNLL